MANSAGIIVSSGRSFFVCTTSWGCIPACPAAIGKYSTLPARNCATCWAYSETMGNSILSRNGRSVLYQFGFFASVKPTEGWYFSSTQALEPRMSLRGSNLSSDSLGMMKRCELELNIASALESGAESFTTSVFASVAVMVSMVESGLTLCERSERPRPPATYLFHDQTMSSAVTPRPLVGSRASHLAFLRSLNVIVCLSGDTSQLSARSPSMSRLDGPL